MLEYYDIECKKMLARATGGERFYVYIFSAKDF